MYKSIFIVSTGSFLGGTFRYFLPQILGLHSASFPFGTFIINVLGCFIIGILYGLFERGNLLNTNLRLFLTVGFCGGFTTFSSFINENFKLILQQNFLLPALYITLSLTIGLLMLYIGHQLVKIA